MKQQKDSSKKVKKMRFEKSYPSNRKRSSFKSKNQSKRHSNNRYNDGYNEHDDFFDFD